MAGRPDGLFSVFTKITCLVNTEYGELVVMIIPCRRDISLFFINRYFSSFTCLFLSFSDFSFLFSSCSCCCQESYIITQFSRVSTFRIILLNLHALVPSIRSNAGERAKNGRIHAMPCPRTDHPPSELLLKHHAGDDRPFLPLMLRQVTRHLLSLPPTPHNFAVI